MDSTAISTKSFVSQWNTDAVITWLRESNLGAFERTFRDNEIDGSILLKLSESMVARLFPTIKLEVQFLDLLQTIKQRHIAELTSKKSLPSSSLTNGRSLTHHHHHHHPATHITRRSSSDHGNGHSSNSNSPTTAKLAYSEHPQIPKESTTTLKTLKREPRYLLNHFESSEGDTKHTFPHVYKLPQFTETLRLALASQDASAFKLRTYYRNLLISSIYDDLTRTYNLWYPNARQYKTVASALVKNYPFLECSTDGGEGAWIDGIKGKFKRGRRTVTSYLDAANAMNGENSFDQMSGDEERFSQTPGGQNDLEMNSNSTNQCERPINNHSKYLNQADDSDEEDIHRLQICITMQKTLIANNDPDTSLILDYFRETFAIRRSFVKTHNTNEILAEYPALQIHSCLLADFHMQTNIHIQTVLVQKIRSISKLIIRLAKETGCAPEILHSYHAILSKRPQLEQILADTFAILIIARYFGEYQYLLISSELDAQSPWPIIRGEFPARAFLEEKSSSLAYNIELDYVQLFHRPFNDFLMAICTLFATYTVFEITYGKLEMTLAFLDCLLRDNLHDSTSTPQVLELINELNSMR